MAQQEQDSPSSSGNVLFVATTTVGRPEDSTSRQTDATRASPITTADIFWAQTPISSFAQETSQGPRTSSVRTQSASHGSASPRPTGYRGNQNDDQSNDNDSGQSEHSKTVLIASITVAVGTLLIILLALFICLRRRKGGKYSKIMRLKLGSNRFMALPIHHQDRDAARTPRQSQFGGMQGAHTQTVHTEKFSTPPNSNASARASERTLIGVDNVPPSGQPIAMPQRVRSLKRPSSLSLAQTKPVEREPTQGFVGLSNNRSLNSLEPDKGWSSPLGSPDARWSWTNSQAPSTPRIAAPNTRPSLTGISVRSVTSWFRGQEGEDRPASFRSHKRKRSHQLLLKNQALKPVLAPPPASKRPSSRTSRIGRRLSGSVPSGRQSASRSGEDQRPLTPSKRPVTRDSV